MLIHFSELVCVKWGGGSGAGAVNVPESLARELFHGAIVGGCFDADFHCRISFLLQSYCQITYYLCKYRTQK